MKGIEHLFNYSLIMEHPVPYNHSFCEEFDLLEQNWNWQISVITVLVLWALEVNISPILGKGEAP